MDNLKKLIDAWLLISAKHNDSEQPEQTYLQLSGFPHYENVCSNLLCFFFNTEESHGLKDLFVRSLLKCIQQVSHTYKFTTEPIERELKTDSGNRIDLVIETEQFVIGVENKMFSPVNNDLADYEAYITRVAKEKDNANSAKQI